MLNFEFFLRNGNSAHELGGSLLGVTVDVPADEINFGIDLGSVLKARVAQVHVSYVPGVKLFRIVFLYCLGWKS